MLRSLLEVRFAQALHPRVDEDLCCTFDTYWRAVRWGDSDAVRRIHLDDKTIKIALCWPLTWELASVGIELGAAIWTFEAVVYLYPLVESFVASAFHKESQQALISIA